MKRPILTHALSAIFVASLLVPFTASAAFSLFDNFDSYPVGLLNGQGPAGNTWTAQIPGTNQVGTTIANTGGTDNALNLPQGTAGGVNYRSLTPLGLSIPNSSTISTVYWNFTMSTYATGNPNPNNWNFIVTDAATPADTAGSSEVQFNYDGTGSPSALFRIRDGANFKLLSTTNSTAGDLIPQANVQYNCWFVIDNAADTYQLFMQSNSVAALATPTQMFADDGSDNGNFVFRNSPNANALATVNLGSASTGDVVQIDDIYVDTAAKDLANPSVVPEPATGMCLAAGAALLSMRRRRA